MPIHRAYETGHVPSPVNLHPAPQASQLHTLLVGTAILENS